MREYVHEFSSDDGMVRRGIVSLPDNFCPGGTVIVINPAGLKYRVGPHRFHVHAARRFAAAGYAVFRFDPIGLGESEGDLGTEPVGKLWREIEEGAFVPDALLSARAMRTHLKATRIIAGGICGGAFSAQVAAASNMGEIDGVFSINTSCTLFALPGRRSVSLSDKQVSKNMRSYGKKILSPHAWSRVFSGQSNIRGIIRTIGMAGMRPFRIRQKNVLQPLSNENPRFIDSFMALEKGGVPHLLLFSGNDNRWLEFQDVILTRYLENSYVGETFRIEVIPEANHELYFMEWQHAAWQHLTTWLEENYPLSVEPVLIKHHA